MGVCYTTGFATPSVGCAPSFRAYQITINRILTGTRSYEMSINPAQTNAPRSVVAGILAVSIGAVIFLLWLLYWRQAPQQFAQKLNFLPELNAVLNACSAVSLCVGLYFIKKKDVRAHRTAMLLAFSFSALFLVSYILNHALHGDTLFPAHGIVRPIYFSILASHILLSIVALPLVLITLFLSLTSRFASHRKIARVTFPIWLYVSVTGVLVFVFLAIFAY